MRWGFLFRAGLIPLSLAVLSPLPLVSGPSIDLETNQIKALSYKGDHILSEVQKACDTLQLRFVGPTHFVPTWGCIDPDVDIMMITGSTTRLDSIGHSFTFSNIGSRLTSYENLLSGDIPENNVYYDKPDKPKWSVKKAIEIGTAFEKIFVDPSEAILGEPMASYDHTAFNQEKARRGQWTISWPRLDSRGHPFYGDHVTIQIQEGFGPLGGGFFLTTPFVEEKGEPMKISEAITKAEIGIKTKQIDRGFESYDDGDTLIRNKFEKGDLIVVLPPKNIKAFGGPSTGNARLAWVIWFRPIHSKMPAHDLYSDSFAVWVDAYDGKIIGSEGWM